MADEDQREGGAAPAPAVARAVAVLDALARSNGVPVSLSDLGREIGAAKSSTLNVCAALEAGRLVQRRDGGYVLGRRTVELGGAYLATFDQLREFYRACAESPLLSHQLVQIAVLEGSDVLYLARHEGRAPLRLSARIGDRFPAALTAVGNALLALLGDEEIDRRLAGPEAFPARTELSTRSLAQLHAKLARVREVGYAVDLGEVHPAVVGIAAAVPAAGPSSPAFAVGVSLVAVDPSSPEIDDFAREVVDVAAHIAVPLEQHA